MRVFKNLRLKAGAFFTIFRSSGAKITMLHTPIYSDILSTGALSTINDLPDLPLRLKDDLSV